MASNSLYKLADVPGFENVDEEGQIYVSSPEFCLLQAAATHSLAQVALYGMEICGTFTPVAGSNDLPKRAPLTSAKRIAAYIERASGSRGYRTASEAAPFILDGSASPMESKLALKLCLPKRKGGMGFPSPVLNEELPLSELPSELAGAGSYRFDLWWKDKGLVVEYDSEQEHTGRNRIARDSVRRNVIDYLGLDVITVTPGQLMNEESFGLVALEIAQHLGIRMRPPKPAVLRARQELDRELFPWRHRQYRQ